MKIFIFALITFVVFCYQCESVEVECKYFVDSLYVCDVLNEELITSKDDREISSIKVNGEHEDGKSDSDVKQFWANGIVVKFFPRGLTKFFKNIEKVEITFAQLEEVSKEDLQEFGGKLKRLWLQGNKIEKLEAALFEFNPSLEWIDLDFNKIKHIGTGAFNGLEKLKTLWLNGNPCASDGDEARNDHSKVLELIEKVEASCKDLNATTVEP